MSVGVMDKVVSQLNMAVPYARLVLDYTVLLGQVALGGLTNTFWFAVDKTLDLVCKLVFFFTRIDKDGIHFNWFPLLSVLMSAFLYQAVYVEFWQLAFLYYFTYHMKDTSVNRFRTLLYVLYFRLLFAPGTSVLFACLFTYSSMGDNKFEGDLLYAACHPWVLIMWVSGRLKDLSKYLDKFTLVYKENSDTESDTESAESAEDMTGSVIMNELETHDDELDEKVSKPVEPSEKIEC